MPLFKRKSKKAFEHNIKAEMNSGKPQKQAVAIAYSVRDRAKKMAMGGEVAESDNKKKTLGDIIGYPKPKPLAMGGEVEPDAHDEQIKQLEEERKQMQEHNQMIDMEEDDTEESAKEHSYAHGGEVSSIAAEVMRRRNPVEEDLADPIAPLESELDELNEAAAPEVSEGPDDFDRQNRIAAIRRRRFMR